MRNRMSKIFWHPVTAASRAPVVPKSYRPKGQPKSTRNEFPIRPHFGNSRKHPIWRLKCGENWQPKEPFYRHWRPCQLSRFSRESPSFSSNLPISRLEHQISRIKWTFEHFCALVWNLVHFFTKFELFLFIVQFPGHFCTCLVNDKG